MTNFKVEHAENAKAVATWGRRRWNVESTFHVEKHGGFGLEHTFCTSDNQSANMHLLMLLAHLLWQVFYLGILRRLYAGCRKLAQKKLAKLIQRAMHTLDPTKRAAVSIAFLQCLTAKQNRVLQPEQSALSEPLQTATDDTAWPEGNTTTGFYED